MRVLHPFMCGCTLCSKPASTFSNGNAWPPITLAEMRIAFARLEGMPRPPSVIYVRRDAWPVLRSDWEMRDYDADRDEYTPAMIDFGDGGYGPGNPPMFRGIPIRIVDHLPRPWMTDLDLPPGVGEL